MNNVLKNTTNVLEQNISETNYPKNEVCKVCLCGCSVLCLCTCYASRTFVLKIKLIFKNK
jgi:hypothetical protein